MEQRQAFLGDTEFLVSWAVSDKRISLSLPTNTSGSLPGIRSERLVIFYLSPQKKKKWDAARTGSHYGNKTETPILSHVQWVTQDLSSITREPSSVCSGDHHTQLTSFLSVFPNVTALSLPLKKTLKELKQMFCTQLLPIYHYLSCILESLVINKNIEE